MSRKTTLSLLKSQRSKLLTIRGRMEWPYIVTYDKRYFISSSRIPIKFYTYWVLRKLDYPQPIYELIMGI